MSAFSPSNVPPQIWHVVFGPAFAPVQGGRWRQLVLTLVHAQPRGFQHCWAFTITGRGWLVVNPGLDGLAAGEVQDADVFAQAIGDPDNTVLLVGERRPGRIRIGWPATCATAIAGLVGATGFRGFLPVQLYRHLINHKLGEALHGRHHRAGEA